MTINNEGLDELVPSWQYLKSTKLGYIEQRINTLVAIRQLLDQAYINGQKEALEAIQDRQFQDFDGAAWSLHDEYITDRLETLNN